MNKEVNQRVLSILRKYNDKEIQKQYITKQGAFSRLEAQKMTFQDMTMFMLANTGKSLSLELFEYFNETNNIENTITKQALSKQRKYIDSKIFQDMNIDYAKEIYKSRSEVFSGYTLIAIDGFTAEIPNTKELKKVFGEAKPSDDATSNARIGIHGLYDALNNIMIKLVVGRYHGGEKTAFLNNVEEVIKILEDKKILFIFDRGYVSLELLLRLEELGVKYLFRVPEKAYKKEKEKIKTNDETIKLQITKVRLKNIESSKQKKYLERKYKEERFVQIALKTGEIEYLITNLSTEEVPYERMKELYFKRWNIEKIFNILKNRLHIENIGSRSKNGIEQEIQSTVFLGNIIEDMSIELNKKLKKKKQKNMSIE